MNSSPPANIRIWILAATLLSPLGAGSTVAGSTALIPVTDHDQTVQPAGVQSTEDKPVGLPRSCRMFSPRLAAILAASLPRYNPAAPRPEPVIGDRPTDVYSDDSILRLPKLVVHGPKPPVFRERDLAAPRALTKIAMHRYSSQLDRALNRYRLPIIGIPPEARALAMYAEAERLRNMDDLDRVTRAVALVDRAGSLELRRLAAATFHR